MFRQNRSIFGRSRYQRQHIRSEVGEQTFGVIRDRVSALHILRDVLSGAGRRAVSVVLLERDGRGLGKVVVVVVFVSHIVVLVLDAS